MISVRTSLALLHHLRTYEEDGSTVASALFDGGRLSYPGRKDIEYEFSIIEPYTLELEARVIEGLPVKFRGSISFLARVATEAHRGLDPTLDLLWAAHSSFRGEGVALDRLVAALVTVQDIKTHGIEDAIACEASLRLIAGMHSLGLPPTHIGLEEIFDGADPACLGLGLVELAC